MVKQPAFIQPDGISKTLLKEDMYVGMENWCFSSVFSYKNSHSFALRWRRKSLFIVLLLVCGDVETQPGPSSPSQEQFKQFLSGKGITIVHHNIRGLVSNFHMLQEVVASYPEIDIIALTETHLTKTSWDSRYGLDGFVFIHRDRDQRKGGGVAMFVKDNITFKRREDLEKSVPASLMIEIALKNSKPFLVGCFYRPPETSRYSSESYNSSLQSHLSDVLKENKEEIMLGDFNVNYKNLHENTEFKTTLTLNGFKQLIKKPTRITQTSSTLMT